jgi:hypothetical protein
MPDRRDDDQALRISVLARSCSTARKWTTGDYKVEIAKSGGAGGKDGGYRSSGGRSGRYYNGEVVERA